MEKTKRHANKDYSGDKCWQCQELLKGNKTQEQINKAHEDCHGWYHCENECCGGCSVCGG